MASIEHRGGNSYRITVSDGYDIQGKKRPPKRKTVTLEPGLTPKQTEKELQRLATEFESEVKRGIYLDGGKITFAQFAERWIHDYAEKQLAPKTLHRYKELLNTRILPALGHLKLDKLQPVHLLSFYDNLKEKGIRIDQKYLAKPELQEVMKNKGLKVKELADMAGIDDRTLKGLLSGKSITHITANAISKALDVKIDNILIPKGDPGTLSDESIKHHHRLISSMLTCAVQWQLILHNPAARVKPPKVEKKEAAHYDEDMTEKMLSLLDNEPLKYKTIVNIAVYSGCRLGELAGLEWSDIDIENNLMRIHQASQYIPGQGVITKSPKNQSSQRIFSIPPVLTKLLKEYKTWQNEERLKLGDLWQKNEEQINIHSLTLQVGPVPSNAEDAKTYWPAVLKQWNDLYPDQKYDSWEGILKAYIGTKYDRIFTSWNGFPIHPITITKWFKTFRERHNLPDLKFHGLRHTNATLLIGQGVDIQTIATRLGHSKPTTTTNVYSHFLRRPDQEAANKLQELFGKKKSDKAKKA